MKRLDIYYSGWSEDWLLGSLADTGKSLLFEYSQEALELGLEFSPLHLRLRPQAFDRFPSHLHRLPGLLADSLPDGWGLMLMDRLFRKRGLRNPSPLDRLTFIGDRAMGALRFVPADSNEQVVDWSLSELALQTALIIDEHPKAALEELNFLGGSPQGARPKALVQFDASRNLVSTVSEASGEPWLIKFPAPGEHKEVCALEQLYAELARDCGLDVPASQWFEINKDTTAFGVQRFDRVGGQRVACHSLAGLLHADFRVPGAVDYTAFLRATRVLTCDEKEVEKAFARAVFNVLFHNRDDHPKNFSWCLGRDRRWRLAPAFDLTFSDGPMGQHHMDVCGQAQRIGRDHLLALAKEGGVRDPRANETIERMLEQVTSFKSRAKAFAIRKATVDRLTQVIDACAALLRR